MNIDEKLKELGLSLPSSRPTEEGYPKISKCENNLLYCSACGSITDSLRITGKVGLDLTLEQAQQAARLCLLNLLSNLKESLGDLNRIKRIIKMQLFINCSPQFAYHTSVAGAALDLLSALFPWQKAATACTAIGVYALAEGAACEMDLVVQIA